MVQPGPVRRGPAAALPPESEDERAGLPQKGILVTGIAGLADQVELEDRPVEPDRAVEVANVQADMPGGEAAAAVVAVRLRSRG